MRKRRLLSLVLVAALLILSSSSQTFGEDPVENRVHASQIHRYSYSTQGDVISNLPLDFVEGWGLALDNWPDLSGESVFNPKLVIESDLDFIGFYPDDPAVFLADPGNGIYTWDFDGIEVKEGESVAADMWTTDDTISILPRCSAERSVVPEVLAEPITLQDVTVTFRLEEPLPPEINSVGIIVGNANIAYEQYRLVETRVVSQDPVDGWTFVNEGPRGSWGTKDPGSIEIGKTYTFHAVLEARKSPLLLGSPIAKPYASIHYLGEEDPEPVISNSVQLNLSESLKGTCYSDNVVTWYPSTSDPAYAMDFAQVVSQITPPPPPFHVLVPADVRIEPETLNRKSEGVFTAFVRLPEQYNVNDVLLNTITCENAAEIRTVVEGDTLIVKFKRQDLQELEPGEEIELKVSGELKDGSIFEGTDTVRVIN